MRKLHKKLLLLMLLLLLRLLLLLLLLLLGCTCSCFSLRTAALSEADKESSTPANTESPPSEQQQQT